MPTYEFKCKECVGVVIETDSREQIPDCPDCNRGMVRVYQLAGIRFLGQGFYSTDKSSSKGKGK